MEELHGEDEILVFTRIPAEEIDGFMENPELVLAMVEGVGFDRNDLLESFGGKDSASLYQLMEGRWSGEEMNFSFENYWGKLEMVILNRDLLDEVVRGGRDSQIFTEVREIRVLNPSQVQKIQAGLAACCLTESSEDNEDSMMLESLFAALQRFFFHAAGAGEFVLVSFI